MLKPRLALILLLALSLYGLILAGTTGKISGVVTDKETGAPLPGVAVSIAGTTMGALTDVAGKYFILNVPAGIYDIRAEIIGYAPVELKGLNVSVDLTANADLQVSSKVLDIGQTQIVTAERPMIIRDQTSSLKLVSKDEVRQMPTRGYQDVVGLSAGVVANYKQPPTLNLRGARENTNAPVLNVRGGRQGEVAYYVDGFSQQDPLTNLSTTSINNNAIEEISISTGGFNAEYGWVSSGAINVTTKEGTKKYSGSIEGITDGFMEKTHRYDNNTVALNLDGPLPIGQWKDKGSFFVSMERRRLGDRSPRANADGILPHNDLSGWTWQGKLKYDINKKNTLRLGTLGSRDDWKEFRMDYYYDQVHAPHYLDENYSYYGKWTSNLSPKSFFEVGTTYYQTKRTRGDGMYWTDLTAYGRPGGLPPGGNPLYDGTNLFFQSDSTRLVWRHNQATGDSILVDDGVDYGHVFDDYLKRSSSYFGGDFALTSQINKSNLVQFGLNFETHRLRYYNHLTPTKIDTTIHDPAEFLSVSYQDANTYGYDLTGQHEVNNGSDGVKKPYTFAVYLQDKVEWQGLVINAGIRYDYLNVNTLRLRDEFRPMDPDGYGLLPNPTDTAKQRLTQVLDPSDFEKAKAEQKLSPRLGIGFPVSDKTVFHINYGKFFQRPELQYLYVGTPWLQHMLRDSPYYQPAGNPNLKPEETTAYEVGLAHQLGDFTSFNLTAYYKDVRNLTEVLSVPSSPNSFWMYRNQDFGTIKGLDFRLNMRRNRSISGELDYSLSFASGTGSYATTQSNIAWTLTERPIRISPLEFDQRHKITAILDVRAEHQQGPKIGSAFPLENAGVNFLLTAGSGLPFTPVIQSFNPIDMRALSPNPAGQVNSRNMPWTFRLDLKANKTIYIGKLGCDAYLWVINVLNTKNVINVYETSGEPNNTGWLTTPAGQEFLATNGSSGLERYNLKQRNPMNYDTPRQVRFGLRVSF